LFKSRIGSTIGLVFILIGLFLSYAIPVFAIGDPSGALEIYSCKAFQNLWVNGDQLYVVEYNIPYTTLPSEAASSTFIFSIMSGATTICSIPVNYYRNNIISIYRAPSDNLTWGAPYNCSIGSAPTIIFPSGPPAPALRSLGPASWITGTMSQSKALLGDYLTQLVQDLVNRGWTPSLLTADGKINDSGKLLLSEDIPGITSICPSIFSTYSTTPTFTRETTPTSLQTGFATAMGANLRTTLQGLSLWIMGNANYWMFMGAGGLALLWFVLAGRIFTATGSLPIALVASVPFLFMGTILGLIPVAIMWAVTIIAVLVFGVVFILGRLA